MLFVFGTIKQQKTNVRFYVGFLRKGMRLSLYIGTIVPRKPSLRNNRKDVFLLESNKYVTSSVIAVSEETFTDRVAKRFGLNYAVYAVLSGSSIVHIGICNDVWYLPVSVKKHGGTGMLLLSWYLTEQEAIRIQRHFIQALAKVESLRYVDVTYKEMPRYTRHKGHWIQIN